MGLRSIEDLVDKDRVVSFSDAVFAFAATLLVLKIDLPTVTQDQLLVNGTHVFATLLPQYFANIISFLIIGYYWINHHAIFGLMKRINATIVWLNLIFLISLSFLPFPVDMFGDFPRVPFVVILYSGSLALAGFLLAIIWWYTSKDNLLVDSELSNKERKYYLARILIAPIVFSLSIPLVYIDPILAQISWILVLIGVLIINRGFGYQR